MLVPGDSNVSVASLEASKKKKKVEWGRKKVKDKNKAEAHDDDGEQGRFCQAPGMSMTSIWSQTRILPFR